MKHVTFHDGKVFLITLHLFHVTRWGRSLRGQSSLSLDFDGCTLSSPDGACLAEDSDVYLNWRLRLQPCWLVENKVLSPRFPHLHPSPSFPAHCPAPSVSSFAYPLNPSLQSLRRPPSHLLSEHHFSNGLLEGAHLHLLSLFFHLHPSPPSISAGPLSLSPLPACVCLILRLPLYSITAYPPNLSPIHLFLSTTIYIISPHPSPTYLDSALLLGQPFP